MRIFRKFAGVIAAAVIAVSAAAVPVSAAQSAGIDDKAGLYSASDKERLEKRQQEVADLTGWNIAVITSTEGLGTDGARAMKRAEQYYDELFGIGSSSVVYLIDLDYRWVAMDGDVLDYFNTKRFDEMTEKCEKRYMAYDDVGNLEAFYDGLEKYYNAGTVKRDPNIGPKGEDYYSHTEIKGFNPEALAPCIVIGAIVALISALGVVSSYKFRSAPTANVYLDSKSVNFYDRRDTFVREHTTRTKIDSGGGGGSHGGSSHHGGGHHGGGGHGGRR